MPLTVPSNEADFTALLNLPLDTESIRQITHGSDPDIKTFSDCTYHNYKDLGMSLCFVPDHQDVLKLDAIHLYNAITRDGFKHYRGELPMGVTNDMKAHAIVQHLGEPDRKGGGGRTGIPCWIEYTFPNDDHVGGINFQLLGTNWDDRDMEWTSLALFRKTDPPCT